MKKKIHKVGIVLNPDFGIKLINLLKKMHVWYIASKNNQDTVDKNMLTLKKIWSKTDENDPFDLGMSTLPYDYSNNEDIFIELIEEIEDHHGEHHHDPPWSQIEVYGTALTSKIKLYLEQLGANKFDKIKDGFICYKIAP